MATELQVALGALVLGVVLSDLVTTTVAPSLHGGWLTRRVGVALWSIARRLAAGRRRLLQVAGLALVVGLVSTWILSLLLGWALVMRGAADLRTADGAPTGWWDTLYYAGYTVSTLGTGDVVPAGPVGQMLTVVASITGLLVLTMAITYLVPVLRAAADRRILASTIHALGTSPQQIADNLWPDAATGRHDDVVRELTQSVRHMTQAHSSYPVLHFFSARHVELALAPNVTALDEALATVVGEDPSEAPLPERCLYQAISSLLDALMASFVRVDVQDTPPPPALHGIDGPQRAERRRRLSAWCTDDGWTWEDAVASSSGDRPRTPTARA